MSTGPRLVSGVLLWMVLAGCAAHRETGATRGAGEGLATGFIDMTTVAEGREQPCVLFVPRDYDPGKPWPLIVFLHGMGERGNDGLKQTAVGIGEAIRRYPKRFPCLVLMPQCPTDSIWGPPFSERMADLKDGTVHVDDALAQVLERYNVDRKRISLTGLSMGGYGTFLYGAKRIETFSALMPICGGGRPEDASVLAKRPMRVFHGADDPAVPPEQSRRMVEAIEAAGGDVEYTEYPDTGHDSWVQAYRDRKAIEWLLEQRLD